MAKRKKQTYKRRIKVSRILLLLFIILVPVAIGLGVIKWMSNDPYAKYQTYNESSKTAGKMKQEETEKEEVYYRSVYYPVFDIKVLDEAVKQYKDTQVIKDMDTDGMFYVSVDYDSAKVFDRFITVTFHEKVVNDQDKVLSSKDTSFNYDSKTDKLLTVKDVLRRDYIGHMNEKAKTNNLKVKDITTKQLNNFIIHTSDITFYFNNDTSQKVALKYAENKQYMALSDKNIPSLYQGEKLSAKAQPKVNEKKKLVAFTFDDGPHGEYTQTIMKEFEKYDGRASFFMLGQNAAEYPDIVKDVYQRGFEVGNHSWDHSEQIAVSSTFSKQQVSDEVYKTCDTIYEATGHDPKLFRPPYGAVNSKLFEVNQLGYAFWDVDSRDWESKNASAIQNVVVKSTTAGNVVVLLHDIHEFSMESVKNTLSTLDGMGYQFVTYSTLMNYEKEYLTQLTLNYGVPANKVLGE